MDDQRADLTANFIKNHDLDGEIISISVGPDRHTRGTVPSDQQLTRSGCGIAAAPITSLLKSKSEPGNRKLDSVKGDNLYASVQVLVRVIARAGWPGSFSKTVGRASREKTEKNKRG
jgi:hypothetical protein